MANSTNFVSILIVRSTELGLYQIKVNNPLVISSLTSASSQLNKQFFNCQYPNLKEQLDVQSHIDKILAGKQNKTDATSLSKLINQIIKSNDSQEKGVVLGCTEFSVSEENFPLQSNGLDKQI